MQGIFRVCHPDKGPIPGYYCKCKKGYEGNPYIGCQDIDECLAEINPCGNGTCQNSPESYSCKCNKGFKNDGPQKCIARPTANNTPLKISLGICIGFFVLLVIIFGLYREYKRRQFNQMKKKYFEANGGPKLQLQLKQLASQKESLATQIFTAEQLKKATKDYDENEKIGEGGYGIVYKGVLDDKREVAIKMSKMTAQVKSDQFINEVIVLSQISHRNVVRLLGCCLETETPMLVYEFVGNGTLYDHIHKKKGQPLSFAQRLKIAAETATALSYLHHSTTMQIVHRDVKATNILLDEKLTAKVSDFGASKLVPDDKTQLSTLVQGTMGYLDPEYLQSNTLTEKSDVYSFGVVLVELLTSENAVRFDKPEAERNLANVFVSIIEEKGLRALGPILDDEIVKDGNWEIIEKVANLAKRCLSVKGDERPTMKQVERELDEILRTLAKQPGGKKLYASSSKETDTSLESHSNDYNVEISNEGDGGSTGIISSAEYDASMQNQAQKPSGYGR
ncbi:wall-associated receptor kinase 3 [Rosa chinensis]|uniref:wall-associated receptor kinase 3 n=1 Tax=Rosa chinensis TaxID=74649 RepID=UPI000D08BDE5|nr:wall-associated receptor kinase 3 [Rosa chinensis]